MDLDQALVSAILREGREAFVQARDRGLDADRIYGPWRGVFDFLTEYYKQYGDLPSPELAAAKMGVSLVEVAEPSTFFVEEIFRRGVTIDLQDSVKVVATLLEQSQPIEALDRLDNVIRTIRRGYASSGMRVESLPMLLKTEVWPYYQRIKAGERGVLFPWDSINDATYGLWPEDLMLLAARVGIGKCIDAESEIVDPDTGVPRTIQELYERPGSASVTTWSEKRGVHTRRITAKHDTGRKKCLRFELKSGRSIVVTPEHPFLTPEGWRRADQLGVGCTVGTPARMPFPRRPRGMKGAELDLLALLLAEGSTTGHHIGFSTEDPSILRLAEIAAEGLGADVVHREAFDYDFVGREHHVNPVLSLVRRHGLEGKKAVQKTLPQAIWRLGPEQLARFLSVFWMCDGYVARDGSPGVTLGSETLVRQLQSLLLRFGVQSSVRYKAAKCSGRVFDSWRLRVYSHSVAAFAALIPLWGEKGRRLVSLWGSRQRNANVGLPIVSEEKMVELKALAGAYGFRNPNGDRLREVARRWGRATFTPKDLFYKRDGGYSVSLTGLQHYQAVFELPEDLSWWWGSHLFWDEVESISDAGVRKIYDLTVEPTSCFVANDILVHNTWVTVLLTDHFWSEQKKRVLYGTTEVSKLRIAMRFASASLKVPYDDLRLGRLTTYVEDRFQKAIEEICNAEGLGILGGTFDFRVESYEDAIQEFKPDVVLLDGAYLLQVSGSNRLERAANAFDELKRICKRTTVPSLVTTQFNREAKANVATTIQVERLALTDVASWNADLIYGLIQTDDMKRDRRMIFKPLKTREGVAEEFECVWDFQEMNFSELPREKAGGGGEADDAFGTGADAESAGEVPF